MKNKFFMRTFSAFLTLIFIFGLVPSTGFAQVNPPLREIKGFNVSVFDSHFSRADRELSPERWLAEAKLGITQALCAWELIAGSLYENPMLLDEAKDSLEKWSNEEFEKRFSQWLLGRFFGKTSERALIDLSVLFDETQKNFSWHLDDEGNILFDDKTGDPLVIRPNDDNREFSQDLLLWRGEAEDIVRRTSSSFENVMNHLYPELLAYIPIELRKTMNSVIYDTVSAKNVSIKREFENIAAREERIFTSRRTRDIWSLRRKSDNEAAKLFTERLIAETDESCKKGIEELTTRIEQAAAGTGDLAIQGEEWLRLYKEQFDKGLKAWEEAEERFFIRRIEWEQESFRLFSEGEEIWFASFNYFEEERQKWELKAKELFQAGEALFKNISEDFERNIAEAKQEFELNMAMRIGEGTTRVKALVDMYLICASAAISAMESVQFWQGQYKGSNMANPKETNFYAWLLGEQTKTNNSTLVEMKKSYDMYVSYMEKALDARDRILADYAELLGTGALKDILSPDASSEDFCLDEYQIALVRAKALVLYWERKTSIAEAVMVYAEEFTAGRMTEAEGRRAWEEAKNAYNASLVVYETELRKLNEAGEDIKQQQEILHNLTQEMLKEEEKLNRLNSDYTALVAVLAINRENYFLLDFNTKYDYLVEEYKAFQITGYDSVYRKALEYGMMWGISEQKETAKDVLNVLINGNGAGMPSLAELLNNVLRNAASEIDLKIRLAAIDLFADNYNGQLRSSNSVYSGADWYAKVKKIDLSEDEKSALSAEKLKDRLVEDYRNSSQALMENRIELELEALFNFLNEDHVSKNYKYALSEACVIDMEKVSYVYGILLNLKERMTAGNKYFTENDEENEIINFFLSGGTFFTGSEQYLTEYFDEYNFCLSLLELFNEYTDINSFSWQEYWQNTCESLTTLFADYNLETAETFLPDAQSICESILEKSGDFLQNAAAFLMDFENCFAMIPQWLEYEISIWRNSIIAYIAAYALYTNIQPEKNSETIAHELENFVLEYAELYEQTNAQKYMDDNEAQNINNAFSEIINKILFQNYFSQITVSLEEMLNAAISTENEKHWRQYLIDEYINNNDPAIVMVSSWKEGMLADALFDAVYYTNRINDSFAVYSQRELFGANGDAAVFYDLFLDEISRVGQRFNSLYVQHNEITNSIKTYELSRMSPGATETQLKIHEDALKAQEEVSTALRNIYFQEADKFIIFGSLYDEQYSILKRAYNNTDQKRFEYEKQDAIQSWASTAYINTDHINLENCKTNLLRAQTVLTVLSDIYNGESRRSYNNPEYDALYSQYEQSFKRKIKILEAAEAVLSETAREHINNEIIYSNYQNSLNQLGYIDQNYLNYLSSASRSEWTIKDIISVKDGRLVFSRDNSMTLTGIDSSSAEELNNFFNTMITYDDERFDISQFEEALRGLSQRMSVYLANSGKFKQWGLARDYLIYSLIKSNSDVKYLNGLYYGIGEMKNGGLLGNLQIKTGYFYFTSPKNLSSLINDYDVIANFESLYHNAWRNLSAEERADLEFYVILTLYGINNDNLAGFAKVHTLDVYAAAENYVNGKYSYAKKQSKSKRNIIFHPTSIPGYLIMKNINKTALDRIQPVYYGTKDLVDKWINGLKQTLSSVQKNASAYKISCEKLDVLEATNRKGQYIGWEEINNALLCTGKINKNDVSALKIYWEAMLENSTGEFTSMPDALTAFLRWAKEEEDKNKSSLNTIWIRDAQNQLANENTFRMTVDAYVAGTVNIETLKTAARNAFGENAAAWKNHYGKIHTVLLDNLSMYLNMDVDFFTEFSVLSEEITLLTAQTLENRYNAEFLAREAEWEQMLKDITEKYYEWLDNAAQIFENGREDWNISIKKMEEAYRQWNINFQNEYERVNGEWAEAYLAGLEDKERWLQQAAEAANQASAESFLSLVGTEGERLSRYMDIREPFGIRNAVPETETLMAELLQSSGIANMTNAFNSINNIASAASPLVRRGMGGISIWDTSLVKTAASDLARKTNAEIAASEARKLAFNARLAADEAIKNLTASVDSANKNFRSNMDNIFIFNGLWQKNGNNYVKEIIKGSTLFTPLITKTVTVTGYANYIMEPITLRTNMDENYLAALDSIAVRGLLENVFIEVQTIAEEIFGNSANEQPLAERGQAPGKFGAHIGYQPAEKPAKEMGKTKSSIFYDEGAGELGRLMSEFIYWYIIDARGSAELALPPWDKRMWDDTGSSFSAPSLRSAGQIVGAIAAAAVAVIATPFTGGASFGAAVGMATLIAGISSTSELIFGTLDVAYGYKTLGEAAFELGKTSVKNFASSMISGAFSGFGSVGNSIASQGLTKTAMGAVTNPAGKILVQTAMTGLQTATTTLATTAISAISYNSKDGFGFNVDMFETGSKSILSNSLSSMTSTFTTATLGAVNSGISLKNLNGFNNINKEDIGKLNGLIGSLAGQGVNYLMGDDFTLNVLNAGLFTNGQHNSGLLELHLGRDGAKMNIGTGGANVSIDNLAAALRGAQVWNVNSRIGNYINNGKNGFDAVSALRALYGYGDTVQKDLLWDILKGNSEIQTDAEGEFMAKTTFVDGKRVINFAGYQQNMSDKDQMRLAVILGHEAYRDGYKTGDIDASGNIVTAENSSAEFKNASIARIAMGNRINRENDWFYDINGDFEFESFLLTVAMESGEHSLFDDYLETFYKNEDDFFWQWADTGGDFQNQSRYWEIPLFNARTRERVDEVNAQRLEAAFQRYILTLPEEGRSNPDLWDDFRENRGLQARNGFVELKIDSIARVGCMFMSTKYGLEAITGERINTIELHNFIRENNYFREENLLSRDLLATIITEYTGGEFTATLLQYFMQPSTEMLRSISLSQDMYIAHLRVKDPNNQDAITHSVMLSGINYIYDDNRQIIGVRSVNVANPLNVPTIFNGKTTFSLNEIVRWDIYAIIPTNR